MANVTTFKDLCLDANDSELMAGFWSTALGLSRRDTDSGNALLYDGVDEHAIWINRVPEARTVKQRVHLDVHTDTVGRLVEAGATVVDDTSFPWTVLADPEGGELCAFVRPPEKLTGYRLYELVVDCVDPGTSAQWWAGVFGLEAGAQDDFSYLEPGAGLPWDVVFGGVPEPKTVKNRIHWDVWGDTETLLAAGASLLRARDQEISWDVLADPEGNEFCVFARS